MWLKFQGFGRPEHKQTGQSPNQDAKKFWWRVPISQLSHMVSNDWVVNNMNLHFENTLEIS